MSRDALPPGHASTLQVRRGRLTFDVSLAGPADGSPVLLLHGFPQFADSWDRVVPLLTARGYRCIAPDQRGYSPGARPRGRRAYHMDHLVDDAVAVIDQLADGGPVDVVGHDWGAAVAWVLAARHSDKVRTLTALSVPHPAAFFSAMLTSRQALRSWYMGLFQLPWLPERVAHSRLGLKWLVWGGQDPARADRDIVRLRPRGAMTGPLNYYRAMPLSNPLAMGRAVVRRPTLFVWSDRDVAITGTAARRCGRWVRDVPFQFHVLTDVSHWIPEEAPEQLAELLVPHLRHTGQQGESRGSIEAEEAGA